MKQETDHYLKVVEWSEEDGCYIGSCPGVIYGGVHGDDESKVYAELCQVVQEALELYKTDGKKLPPATAGKSYSGRFVLRIDKSLHKELAIRALQTGESINSYCQKLLSSALHRSDMSATNPS
jgi:predicted HicB family RNase H-like nuclease